MPFFSAKLSQALLLATLSIPAFSVVISLEENKEFILGNKPGRITQVSTLPYVDSVYSRLFKFESAENPKLKELRECYRLAEIVSAAPSEFAQQVHLMDWVHNRFRKFGQPTKRAQGALEILKGIDAGETFFCTQYAQLMASAAASLGWTDRVLALRRHSDVGHKGSTEHSTTEIWSNQHRKWIMLDPTSNMYLERDGIPLNAYEIRREWFYNGGTNLVFVIGKEGKRYRKSDLPIFLKSFPGFGDLTIDPHELDKYGFIGYIPNTDLLNSDFNYGDMFITKDQLCDGTQWHQRRTPENPETDPYFPINQAALQISHSDTLKVDLKTLTPNFKSFEVAVDRGEWRPSSGTFFWRPHGGTNTLRARSINQFNLAGPISRAEIVLGN